MRGKFVLRVGLFTLLFMAVSVIPWKNSLDCVSAETMDENRPAAGENTGSGTFGDICAAPEVSAENGSAAADAPENIYAAPEASAENRSAAADAPENTCTDLEAPAENGSTAADAPENIYVAPKASAENGSAFTDVSGKIYAAPGLSAEIGNTSPDDSKDEERVIHQPKLILESNNLAAEKIQAGSEREFVTWFRNKSRTDTIYNLSVSVKPADESISLAAASFYYEAVPPQGTIAVSTTARVSTAAEPKKISVEFAFSYENESGIAYNSTETAWLETFQPAQASMEGFSLPEKVFSMETVSAQMQIRNTGHAPIYNAQVVLNAPGLFPTESVFAGTLDAGASYSGSMKIYVGNKNMESLRQTDADTKEGAYGSAAGTLTLTYEDVYGQSYTQTQDFSTYIKEPEIIELTVEKEVETNSWQPAVLAGTVFLFSAALAVMGWRLRQSKRKLEDLLLEEHMYDD